MLTKTEQALFRSEIFRHLDGIALAPVAYALHKNQVTQTILAAQSITVAQLAAQHKSNTGYLNVGLRVLASQGWLNQTVDNQNDVITFSVNAHTAAAFAHFEAYADVVNLMKISGNHHPRKFSNEAFVAMEKICTRFREGYGIPENGNEIERVIRAQIRKHIEGALIGPTIVHLGMGGMFHKYFMEASFRADEYHEHPENFEKLLSFLAYLGWFVEKNGTFEFTDKGLFFARRASAYGVTVSYSPMFRQVEDLIFGDPKKLREVNVGEEEQHVDRAMNVWGSGGAHATYFKKIDEIILEIFNRPIDEQPKGVLDMGCGNGAFLEHVYEVIEQRTLRGQMLDEHPLFLVGADYNEAALRITRGNLIKANIWAKVVWGDIGRPDLLANDLKEQYGIDLNTLLNVRTFLDHNRIWEEPTSATTNRESASTGAFAHRGARIGNNQVEENLLQHFKKWEPYVERFGLLVIELHTVNPAITAANLGKTPATAYDATHGFSDQYIVEPEVFLKVAKEAKLFPVAKYSTRYPDTDYATVTINLLKGNA
jgi:hypothetical protein